MLGQQDKDQLTAYCKEADKYQNLGLVLDILSAGLSVPTNCALGIAGAALNPMASYKIGQYFFKGKVKEKGTVGSATHILTHTVLGAAVDAAEK